MNERVSTAAAGALFGAAVMSVVQLVARGEVNPLTVLVWAGVAAAFGFTFPVRRR